MCSGVYFISDRALAKFGVAWEWRIDLAFLISPCSGPVLLPPYSLEAYEWKELYSCSSPVLQDAQRPGLMRELLLVLDATAHAVVALDRSNRVDYALQCERLKALCEQWHPLQIIAEQNSIGPGLIDPSANGRNQADGYRLLRGEPKSDVERLSLLFDLPCAAHSTRRYFATMSSRETP